MDTFKKIKQILGSTLSLGPRESDLSPESALLGGLPEFDSMAVATLIAMLEDEFGIAVEDDEISAEVFATVGSLVAFVDSKLRR